MENLNIACAGSRREVIAVVAGSVHTSDGPAFASVFRCISDDFWFIRQKRALHATDAPKGPQQIRAMPWDEDEESTR